MIQTPILGQSYVARSSNAAANRLVNLFPEVLDSGKSTAYFQRTPGLRLLQTVGTGPIRGLWTNSRDRTKCYVVSGTSVYVITSPTAAPTLLGTVTGTGPVSIADNGNQVFFACNPDGFIYDQSTGVFSQITDPDFPGANCVAFLDGYFVFTQPNSQLFWVTALSDGLNIDALDFASAEGSPDYLSGLIASNLELWLMGRGSTEVWYNAGQPDFPLARIQGAFNETGSAATYSIAKTTGGAFWLGADARGQGVVLRSTGYQAKRVSTHAVEWQIQSYGNISDAIGYTYQQDGHSFYVLTFPSANAGRGATWCYDEATDAWHEREGWNEPLALPTRHRSNCQTFFDNINVVGDYENGNIYHLDPEYFKDDDGPQRWLRSWRALAPGTNNLNRTAQHALQIDMEAGVGIGGWDFFSTLFLLTESSDFLITESGSYLILDLSADDAEGVTPKVTLRWSDDGGHTWGYERIAEMGKLGETGARVIFRRLGMTMKLRDRVYELSSAAPVKIAIMGAWLDASLTNS